MKTRLFHQVDVFSEQPLRGNPLAVVHGAAGVDDTTMAALARWTNLSETTFLLPPTDEGAAQGADYRVRIFTPGGELPFAGHPTLGSAWAWLAGGGQPRVSGRVVQECDVGLVTVKRDPRPDGRERLAFAAPPLRRSGALDEATLAQIRRALGLGGDAIAAHQWVDNGPGWCAVMLRSAADVLALRPDMAALAPLKLGVIAPQPEGADTAFEVRAFVPGLGIPEDPVTGSLNAGLALWLIGAGLAPGHYVAAQGAALGRAGRVFVERDGDGVTWVGGAVTPVIAGELTL